jgi:hypothetical protein
VRAYAMRVKVTGTACRSGAACAAPKLGRSTAWPRWITKRERTSSPRCSDTYAFSTDRAAALAPALPQHMGKACAPQGARGFAVARVSLDAFGMAIRVAVGDYPQAEAGPLMHKQTWRN